MESCASSYIWPPQWGTEFRESAHCWWWNIPMTRCYTFDFSDGLGKGNFSVWKPVQKPYDGYTYAYYTCINIKICIVWFFDPWVLYSTVIVPWLWRRQMLLPSVSKWELVRGIPNLLFILVLGDEVFFWTWWIFAVGNHLRNRNDGGFGLTKVGDMALADGFLSDIRQVYYSECRLSSVRELRCFGDFRAQAPLSGPLGPRARSRFEFSPFSPVCFYCF